MSIRDDFLDEQLLQIDKITPWFADICNFIVASKFPPEASQLYKEKIENDLYLWKLSNDQVIRRCIPNPMIQLILHFCHSASRGDHYGSIRTVRKVLDYGSTNPPFSETSINLSCHANNGHSPFIMDILTFCLSLTICHDGLVYPKALISDQWSHFCNQAMSSVLKKYGVVHRVATAYHP
ncbi:hypothetical protein CR513_05589, partial [Mucuna pruriens]